MAIATYTMQAADNFPTFSVMEWRIAKKVSEVLQRFHGLTLQFSKVKANIGYVGCVACSVTFSASELMERTLSNVLYISSLNCIRNFSNSCTSLLVASVESRK